MLKLSPQMVKSNEVIATEGDNVVELKLATGGDEPPYHPNDWLSPMADGTIFLFNEKKNPFDPNLGQAKILSRTEKAIYLGFIVNGQPMQGPVDPTRFCTKYAKYEVLGTILNEDQEQEEEGNGKRHRLHGDPGGTGNPLGSDEALQGVPDGPPETRG